MQYLQDRNLARNEYKETTRKSHWASSICVIVGDSMVNSIDKKRLSLKHGNVEIFHFSGAGID